MKKAASLLALTMALTAAAPGFAANEKAEKKGWFRKEIKENRQQHMQQQRQENQALRKDLKELPPAERLAAVQEQRRKQFDENKAFIQSQHEKKMKELDARLAANSKLTPEQKATIKTQAEQQYQENLVFRQQQFEKTQTYVNQVASDPNLTPDQRRAALENYRKEQQKAVQDHFQAQRSENKDLRGSLKKQ
jgi:hypothetical protein